MRLKDVVIQGKCCGLETVEECVTNFYLHGMMMFPYNALEYETRELRNDIAKYEAGKLELPWDQIEEEVQRFHMEYQAWLDDNMIQPDDIDDLEKRLELLR